MYYTQDRLEQCYQPATSTRLEYETRKVCTTNRVQSGVYIALPIAFRPREARVLEAGVEGAGEGVLVGGALDRALGHGRGRHVLGRGRRDSAPLDRFGPLRPRYLLALE